jgi:hypothetical protein
MRRRSLLARVLRRKVRPVRGTPRLVADLVLAERMTGDRSRPARVRLEEIVGSALLRELDRELDLGGRLARRSRSRGRLYRAA